MNSAMLVMLFLGLCLLALMAWLPIHLAAERKHSKLDAIRVCSILSVLLWPLWLVAMIWAFTEDNRRSRLVR